MKRTGINRGTSTLKQTKPINQRSKTNKNRHVANERLTEYHPCQLGLKGCTGTAIETHELLGGGMINVSKRYGFQVKVCRNCHSAWHLKLTKEEKIVIRAEHQKRVMAEQGWIVADFSRHFSINFI